MWRGNVADNASTKAYLSAHRELEKEGADHLPVVLFKIYNMDSDKPVLVVNIPPVRFIEGPKNQVITGDIYGACYP